MPWLYLLLSVLITAPASGGDWTLRLQQWNDADIEPTGAAPDPVERQALMVAWHQDHGDDRSGIRYSGEPLLIRTGDPATNGYLHRVDLEHSGSLGAARMDLSLGVHGSSNIFTHAEFRSEALTGRFDYLYPVSGPTDAVGLAGDYRFGGFLVYPRLTATAPMGDTELFFDLPVGLHWRDRAERWQIGVERYGHKWATLDTTETVEGKLYLSEWRLVASWRFRPAAESAIEVGAGWSFDTEVDYLDLERGRVEEDLDSAPFAFLEFRF